MKTTASRASAVSQTRGFGDLLYDKAGSRPSLDLDFAGTSSLRDKITGEYLVDHTRASNGTYIDSEGLVKEAAYNYSKHSDILYGNATATITSNTHLSPIGTLAGDTVAFNAGDSTTWLSIESSPLSSNNYVVSIHARSVSGTSKFRFKLSNGSTIWYTPDFSTTTEWQRYEYTFNDAITSIAVTNPAGGVAHTNVFWGHQLEIGTTATDYIQTPTNAGGGAPRFTHERVETGNLLSNTENFSDSNIYTRTNVSVQDYAALSPSGKYDAALVTATGSGSIQHHVRGPVFTAGTKQYTVSGYFKAGTEDNVALLLFGSSNHGSAQFQLTGDGSFSAINNSSTPSITKTDNGWYRCSVTVNALTSTDQVQALFKLKNHGSWEVNASNPESIYVWGLQIEEADSASTYVPSIDTFTSRASSATYVDSAGLVKTAALNYILNSDAPSHHTHTTTGSWLTTLSYPASSPTTDGPFGTDQKVKKVVISSDKPDFTQYGSLPLGTLTSDQKIRFGVSAGGSDLNGGIANQTFTWSFYYRSLSGDRRFSVATGADPNRNYAQLTATSEWQRAEVSGARSDTLNILDFFYLFNGAADLEFASFQVEKGNKASDYVRNAYAGSNNPSGVNTSAQARYSHDPETLTPTGLYLEPEGINHFSEPRSKFDALSFVLSGGVDPNVKTTAPDGSNNASVFGCTATASNTQFRLETSSLATASISASNPVTVSFYAKKLVDDPVTINYDLNDYISSTSALTNEWKRYTLTGVPHDYATGLGMSGFIFLDWAITNKTGNQLIAMWGLQVESGHFPTSYIYPNGNAASTTRAADVYTSTANLTETFEPRGLLIEEARTNLATYSNTVGKFSDWSKTGSSTQSVTSPNYTSPMGTTSDLREMRENTQTNHHQMSHTSVQLGTAAKCLTVFVKPLRTDRNIQLRSNSISSNAAWANFDLNAGIVAAHSGTSGTSGNGTAWSMGTPFIEKHANGWYRIGLTNLAVASSTWTFGIYIVRKSATGDGDNFTGDNGVGFSLWGIQYENGAFPTSYIHNETGSSLIRSADIASISGDNFGTYRTNRVLKTLQDPFITAAGVFTRQSYAALAPDGTFSAQKVKITHNASYLQTPNIMSPSIADGAAVTFSFYARTDTGVTVTAKTKMGRNGTENSFPTITITDQWQRFEVVDTGNTIGDTKEFFGLIFSAGSNVNKDVYIWGLQVEENGTGATNFIPSTDTFTSRLGNATYVDSNGLIKTAYKNNVTHSENISSNGGWNITPSGTITNTTINSPNNTLTASEYVASSDFDTDHIVFKSISNGIKGALSIYAKSNGLTHLSLVSQDSASSQAFGVFDLTNGTVSSTNQATAKIVNVGDGWYRCIVYPQITTSQHFIIHPHYGGTPDTNFYGRVTYAGNNSDGIYLWGVQLTDNVNDEGEYVKTEATATGGPRYSHDPETLVPTGLYLEPTFIMNARSTETFTEHGTDAWQFTGGGSISTDNTIVNPDGSTGTAVLTISAGNQSRGNFIGFRRQVSNYPQHCISCFVKKKTSRYVTIGNGGASNYQQTVFDFDTESIYEEAGVSQGNGNLQRIARGFQKFPNGWYRIYLMTGSGSAGNGFGIQIPPQNNPERSKINSGTNTYDGTESVYVWGFNSVNAHQLFNYVPNHENAVDINFNPDNYTSTATTVLDRDGGNKEAFFNQGGDLSYYVEMALPKSNFSRAFDMSSPGECFLHYWRNVETAQPSTYMLYITDAGNQLNNIYHDTDTSVNSHKVALGLSSSSAFGSNGSIQNDNVSVTLPGMLETKAPDSTHIGLGKNNNLQINSTINRMTWWKTRLPNASLTNITQQ